MQINLNPSVESFPAQSAGALRAGYTLANSARNALDSRPAERGIPQCSCSPYFSLSMKTIFNRGIRVEILLAVFCLVSARGAYAQPIMISGPERELKESDIEVYGKITGIATAKDTYDVFAPFDGRVEEVLAELLDFVTPQTTTARLVSTEMAALLDATSPAERKQTEKRWQDVYKYYDVKPDEQGIILNVYIKPKDKVYKGDRLFTMARKVVIVGKNTEPLYSPLAPGMTAEMVYDGDKSIKLKTTLSSFLPLEGRPLYNRVWLEALDLRSGIRIGERFNGYIFVGRSENVRLAPRTAIIEKNGRKYLAIEVETGLTTETETELTKSGLHFLSPSQKIARQSGGDFLGILGMTPPPAAGGGVNLPTF